MLAGLVFFSFVFFLEKAACTHTLGMYSHPPDVYRRTRAVRGCVYAEKGGASSKDTSSKDTSRLGLFVAVCMLHTYSGH